MVMPVLVGLDERHQKVATVGMRGTLLGLEGFLQTAERPFTSSSLQIG